MQGDIAVATQVRDIAVSLLVAEIDVIGKCPPVLLIEGNAGVGRLAAGGNFALQRFNAIGQFQVKAMLCVLEVGTAVRACS